MTDKLKALADQLRVLNPVGDSFQYICKVTNDAADAILALIAEVERLTKELSDTDVLLEECKMDWSGDVIQIKAEHKHEIVALQARVTGVAAQGEKQEPYGYVFGNSFWEATNKRITDDVRMHGTKLYTHPAPGAAPKTIIPDCGEAGHAEGCCGNAQCFPSRQGVV